MRYLYMIGLILSSFFTYKHLWADTYTGLHGFFIPKGTFEENTNITNRPSGRRDTPATQQKTATRPSMETTSAIKKETVSTASQLPQKIPEPQIDKTPKILSKKTAVPSTKKQTVKTASSPAKATATQAVPKLNTAEQDKINEKLKLYSLDDEPKPTQIAPISQKTSQKEEKQTVDFEQKTIKDMLDTLPYPDFKQPKFKQLYASYGLELRTLYRRNKFPPNPEQETALKKATTLRRFKVN